MQGGLQVPSRPGSMRPGSSIRSGVGALKVPSKASSSGHRGPKRASIAGTLKDGEKDLAPPSAPTRQVEGWQMKEDSAMGRVVALFNSYTLCDVVFHLGLREIPAHRFVLSAASPVLNSQFQEVVTSACGQVATKLGRIVRMTLVSHGQSQDNLMDVAGDASSQAPSLAPSRPGSSAGQSRIGEKRRGRRQEPDPGDVVRVEVNEKYEDFYELLRFMYTDQVALSTGNVAALIFMSDDFKLPALSERCLAFLRAEVKPETALKILNILKALMKKAVFSLWREVLDRTKAVKAFKELTLAERHRRLKSLRSGTGSDVMSQTASSIGRGSRMGSRRGSRESLAISEDGGRSVMSYGGRSGGGASSFRSGGASGQGEDATGLRAGDIMKLAFGGSSKSNSIGAKYAQAERNLYMQLALVSEELSEKCWRMIREGTDSVLAGADWVDQDIITIRKILNLDMCNVSEAHLFRALNSWAEHQCKLQSLPLLPEHRRKVLCDGTLELVRFPTMSLEELQWEVVPTGLLKFQELRQLLMAMTGRSGWLPQFSGEKRLHPSGETKRKDSKTRGVGGIPTGGAYSFGVYASREGDEIDAILGARLWRSHVEHFVEEQEDVGLVHEMGVPLASEVDVRPIICGNLMDPRAADKEAITAPHRQNRTFLRRPGCRSPLEMIDRELVTEVRAIQPSMGETASTGDRRTASKLGALPPVASARGPGKAAAHDESGGGARTVAVAKVPPGPKEEAAGGDSEKDATKRRAAVPSDFQRLAKGLYRFRGTEIIEIRLIDGDPLVFEHGPENFGRGSFGDEPGHRRRESFGESDDDDDGGDADPTQVRRKLNLGAKTHRRGVPLDTFICRTATG